MAFLACRDECPESYCHGPGVGVSIIPQEKNFNLGYIFCTKCVKALVFEI
jgi:hypothetical protein